LLKETTKGFGGVRTYDRQLTSQTDYTLRHAAPVRVNNVLWKLGNRNS